MTEISGALHITDDAGRVFWTTAECCAHVGVSASTWSAYVTRGQAPAASGKFDRLSVWDAEDVRTWHAARRSQRHE